MGNGTNSIFHHFYDDSSLCSAGPSRLASSCPTATPSVASPCTLAVVCPGRGQPLQKISPSTQACAASVVSAQSDPHWLVVGLDSGRSVFHVSQHKGCAKEYLLGISYLGELSLEDHCQAYMQVAFGIKKP